MNTNIWNKWDPLKTVMLGSVWTPDFFKEIKNDKIRSPLQRIAEETINDLDYFEKVLKDFGSVVVRPELPNNDSILNYINDQGHIKFLPRPPLQPRDNQIVSGNNLYYNKKSYDSGTENPAILSALKNNFTINEFSCDEHFPCIIPEENYNSIAGADFPSYDYFIRNRTDPSAFKDFVYQELRTYSQCLFWPSSANCFLIGKDIYVDYNTAMTTNSLKKMFPDVRINVLKNGYSHYDACFLPLKEGVAISEFGFTEYQKTFPNWDICFLQGENWSKISKFFEIKQKNQGKWWVPGEESNEEFINFVDSWLSNWVGYIEETLFDVNVLVLDEKHVCVNNMNNKKLLEFLKKHKIEPVHIPWRHRYFWDGGLHCITLDLDRAGHQVDYFPDRQYPIVECNLTSETSYD